MEYDDLEKHVRDALIAEAEAGPDYATVLHARIMARIVVTPQTSQPLPQHPTARRQMMMMAAMVIGIALLAILVFQVMR